MVQTWKKGLQKIYFIGNKEDSDLALPYITMGYRMSKHASLFHFAPYFYFLGDISFHPFPLLLKWTRFVDLDSPVTWARVIAKRVVLFKRVVPTATENLSIA
jgi:hypothetical protein